MKLPFCVFVLFALFLLVLYLIEVFAPNQTMADAAMRGHLGQLMVVMAIMALVFKPPGNVVVKVHPTGKVERE